MSAGTQFAQEQALVSPATVGAPTIRIYQNFYADKQEMSIDPAFISHDGRRNANTHYREVGLFSRMYHSGEYLSADYTGIVSPKFQEKTNKTGAEFIRFMRSNPGYDVYFINPFPQNAYYSFNVWQHGELCHPGLIALASRLFEMAEIPVEIERMGRNDARSLLYSNYWAGNERFWDAFMHINVRLLTALENAPPHVRERYFEIDPIYPDKVPALPFIFERVFSTLLLMNRDIKGLAFPWKNRELFDLAARNRREFEIVSGFKTLVDSVDRRGVYDARDMALFDALDRLRRA